MAVGPYATVPSPSSSELAAIVQAAGEDRNGTVLDAPTAPRLANGQTTAAYRAKRERDLPYAQLETNGPSSVPAGYSLPQTATFRASADGWQLDSIAPSVHGGGLPMSVVEG
ncbi:hypothetical protein DQ354_17275 [Arthrobacter sp. AQ5-06]|nr:hypothetical protein DQ354_17275 [Arthrobacter sp. AQ5-06]